MSELDRLTRELVKQMMGRDVDDEQDGDYQIAYHYLSKAMKLRGQSEQLKAFQEMVNETKGYTAISDELIDKHLKSL